MNPKPLCEVHTTYLGLTQLIPGSIPENAYSSLVFNSVNKTLQKHAIDTV